MLPKLKSEERRSDHFSKKSRTAKSSKSSLPSVVAPSHISSDEESEIPIVMTAAMKKYRAERAKAMKVENYY